jgi:hypothetical protein
MPPETMNRFPLPNRPVVAEKTYFDNEKDVDVLLANELNRLSIQERENVFEEIHGVDPVVEESEEMIRQSLEQLSKEIERIEVKKAYNMALNASSTSREYVESTKFRLMFLRSENFRVTKAATRLVLYMEGM